MQLSRCVKLNTERNKDLKGEVQFMVKKNTIGPIPIIVVDKPRLDENESFETSNITLTLTTDNATK